MAINNSFTAKNSMPNSVHCETSNNYQISIFDLFSLYEQNI
jgi:hypothetical protein